MTLLARTISLVCILVFASIASAQARTRHLVESSIIPFDRAGGGSEIGARILYAAPHREARQSRTAGLKHRKRYQKRQAASAVAAHVRTTHARVAGGEAQLLPHPSGCPSRAFCGCGAALEVFGKHVRELWLARAWFKFPSAPPAPGMVAVRRHHVFVIREVRAPGLVLAYDANSGGHRTRLHLRSLAGYRVVNPRGSAG